MPASSGGSRSLYLRLAATGITMLTAAGSAGYVSAHVKNAGAPLHPSVGGGTQYANGRLSLSPSVKAGNVEAVTSTYAS